MNKAKIDREKVRDEKLIIRLSKAERESFENAAYKRGLTMSALARMIIADYLNGKE